MQNISRARKAKGYSQEKLALKLGLSRSAVSMWEIGATNPDGDTLKSLSALLDVSTDYLLGLSDTKKAPAAGTGDESEKDADIKEMAQIMRGLPDEERRRAIRTIRAAFADGQVPTAEADGLPELKK